MRNTLLGALLLPRLPHGNRHRVRRFDLRLCWQYSMCEGGSYESNVPCAHQSNTFLLGLAGLHHVAAGGSRLIVNLIGPSLSHSLTRLGPGLHGPTNKRRRHTVLEEYNHAKRHDQSLPAEESGSFRLVRPDAPSRHISGIGLQSGKGQETL